MEPLPQKVLNWLHRVLQTEYSDVNTTYAHVAQCLAESRGLQPSTDVYTFENGRSSLLLHLSGTVPISFRGVVYAIPISIWVPQTYPKEAPIVFVTPAQGMAVRAGQHVSGEGRIYHPYLASWRADRSTIAELVRVLQDIFSREPPVVAQKEPEGRALPASNQRDGVPPPRPPLPPELAGPSSSNRQEPVSPAQPPPPPPKPFQGPNSPASPPNVVPPIPPRPPLPGQHYQANSVDYNEGFRGGPALRHGDQSYGQNYAGPSPPPRPLENGPPSIYAPRQEPMSPVAAFSPDPERSWRGNAWQAQPGSQLPRSAPPPAVQPVNTPSTHLPQTYVPGPYDHQQSQQHSQQLPPTGPAQMYTQHRNPPPTKSRPPEDLLTSPFDPPLPTTSEPAIAPPIPPNPEKDALLSAASHMLTKRLHSNLSSNTSALQTLQAQYHALLTAQHAMETERQSLSALESLLSSNESILRTAMRDADACISNAQRATVPSVDEVLVAPSVVGQQLYELCAEERACADVREVLGRGLDSGRVGVESWVKAVRGLARDEFIKKVLIRKCAEGMGLRREEGEGWVQI